MPRRPSVAGAHGRYSMATDGRGFYAGVSCTCFIVRSRLRISPAKWGHQLGPLKSKDVFEGLDLV